MFDWLLGNRFVQSLGVGALVYLTLKAIDIVITFFLGILETLSQWYRYHASVYAEEIAIAAVVIWLIWAGVINSRRSPPNS